MIRVTKGTTTMKQLCRHLACVSEPWEHVTRILFCHTREKNGHNAGRRRLGLLQFGTLIGSYISLYVMFLFLASATTKLTHIGVEGN
jgi:hypothetical protein